MATLSDLVFYDPDTPLDQLIEHYCANPIEVTLDDPQVRLEKPGQAVEGEVWSPQLPPYEEWRGSGLISDEEVANQDPRKVGLLGWGRLNYITDELRDKLTASAVYDGYDASHSAAVAKHISLDAVADNTGACMIREDFESYVLSGFDLRRYAACAGHDRDLVVVVPAMVNGLPVKRITAEAFIRRLVRNIGVRLLIIPDTVERIAADGLQSLAVEHIHLGRKVLDGGEQACDLAGVRPRLEKRTYSVSEGNKRYSAHDGNLYSVDGTRLLFLQPPYDAHLTLPAGVQRVGARAFAEGCDPARAVYADAALERVDSKVFEDALWICPPETPARERFAKRDVRFAGLGAVEHEGCWYDFNDEGAVLVAGPPKPSTSSSRFAASAAELQKAIASGEIDAVETDEQHRARRELNAAKGQLAGGSLSGSSAGPAAAARQDVTVDGALMLPESVEGRPLVRIANRAITHVPGTLVVSDSVRHIERQNACLGAKRVILGDGVRTIGAHSFRSRMLEGPVSIPSGVRSVGQGSFEYAVCRLEHTGSIVHIPADQMISPFIDASPDSPDVRPGTVSEQGVPFDYERYDKVLMSIANLPDRLGAVVQRVAHPTELEPAVRKSLVAYLNDHLAEAQRYISRQADCAMLDALMDAGFINDTTFDKQIELLRSLNRTDCVLYMMERHRKEHAASQPKSTRERFAL